MRLAQRGVSSHCTFTGIRLGWTPPALSKPFINLLQLSYLFCCEIAWKLDLILSPRQWKQCLASLTCNHTLTICFYVLSIFNFYYLVLWDILLISWCVDLWFRSHQHKASCVFSAFCQNVVLTIQTMCASGLPGLSASVGWLDIKSGADIPFVMNCSLNDPLSFHKHHLASIATVVMFALWHQNLVCSCCCGLPLAWSRNVCNNRTFYFFLIIFFCLILMRQTKINKLLNLFKLIIIQVIIISEIASLDCHNALNVQKY